MPDEDEPLGHDDQHDPEQESAGAGRSDEEVDANVDADADATQGSEADEPRADEPGERASVAGEPPSQRELNRAAIGEVTLHYPQRDVTVLLDGQSAMRLLTMYRTRREGGLADPLHPEDATAWSGWLVLDLAEPLAISWMPNVRQRPRTAIDPAPAAAT